MYICYLEEQSQAELLVCTVVTSLLRHLNGEEKMSRRLLVVYTTTKKGVKLQRGEHYR